MPRRPRQLLSRVARHAHPGRWPAALSVTIVLIVAIGLPDPVLGVAPIRRPPTTATTPEPPVPALDPLTVEQGNLTLRWHAADDAHSVVADGSVRIEAAPATPTGCGTFEATGGIPLEPGIYDRAALSLGTPPSNGCLRVLVALTDPTGRTSVTVSQRYRIQPPVDGATASPKASGWDGTFNLYRPEAFVTQKTFRWCVAASVQMMVNLIRNHRDRTTATQARMIAYAQLRDNGPYGEDGGTDVTGWITALGHFGAGNYRAVGATTAARALRVAATAMRQTGRPAGILVMDGRHAWVLHGFESRTDPRFSSWPTIDAVRISGPLYPIQQKAGYDPRPNTRLSVRALARYFTPSSVGALAGRYVVIVPAH